GSISGYKFEDINANGSDDSEPGLTGWTIELYLDDGDSIFNETAPIATQVTSSPDGAYSFIDLAAGDYWVREVPQSGWLQTSVDPSLITIESGDHITEADYPGLAFGNYLLLIDLTGSYFNVIQEPLDAGDTFDVDFVVRNLGTDSAGGFWVDFFLSTDSTITTSDYLLGQVWVPSLSGDSTTGTLSTSLTLPGFGDPFWLGYHVYYVGMLVDGTDLVAETNEANNASTGFWKDYDDVLISQLPDLKPTMFNVVKEPLNAGKSFDVDYEIQNTGAASAGGFYVNFYASNNYWISTGDYYLGQVWVAGVSAGSDTGTLSTNLTLPAAGDPFWVGDQVYYIGMIVDSTGLVTETSESNNRNVGEWIDSDGVSVSGTAGGVDLRGSYFNTVQEPLVAGDSFDVQFVVQNTGSAGAGGFYVDFYASANSFISTGDYYLGQVWVAGVSAGSDTGTLTTNLTLPGAGDPYWVGDQIYYIGMIVDSTGLVTELNESNNRNRGEWKDSDGVSVSGTAGGVDLSGSYFNTVQEPLNAGDSFDVDFVVQNTGTDSAGGFWVNIYASTDSSINTSDYYLGQVWVAGLSGGSTTGTLTTNLTLPAGGDPFWVGDQVYYIGMIVDSTGLVTETDESDNSNLGEWIDSDGVLITV
ncbi:CARDB domain-containing protein, partial [Planctomycetota bacterium]